MPGACFGPGGRKAELSGKNERQERALETISVASRAGGSSFIRGEGATSAVVSLTAFQLQEMDASASGNVRDVGGPCG